MMAGIGSTGDGGIGPWADAGVPMTAAASKHAAVGPRRMRPPRTLLSIRIDVFGEEERVEPVGGGAPHETKSEARWNDRRLGEMTANLSRKRAMATCCRVPHGTIVMLSICVRYFVIR